MPGRSVLASKLTCRPPPRPTRERNRPGRPASSQRRAQMNDGLGREVDEVLLRTGTTGFLRHLSGVIPPDRPPPSPFERGAKGIPPVAALAPVPGGLHRPERVLTQILPGTQDVEPITQIVFEMPSGELWPQIPDHIEDAGSARDAACRVARSRHGRGTPGGSHRSFFFNGVATQGGCRPPSARRTVTSRRPGDSVAPESRCAVSRVWLLRYRSLFTELRGRHAD